MGVRWGFLEESWGVSAEIAKVALAKVEIDTMRIIVSCVSITRIQN